MSVVDQYTTINHDKEAMLTELRAQLAKQLSKEIEHVPEEYLITSLLLAELSVEDCTVVRRQVVDKVKRVAYVVTSEGFSQERLTKHLQTYLPADLMPDYYVPVSAIPLTPKGLVDGEQLAQIAVLDDDLVDHWESALMAQPGVTAAVIIQPQTLQSPVVHLSDLLPTWTNMHGDQGAVLAETETIEHPTELLTATPSSMMALSYGGDLPVVPGFPQTLPEVLVQSAKTALGDRITYLNLDGTVHHQSYQGLLDDAEHILAGLRKQGLKPQDKVIFQLELSQDILSAFWACILGGFIPVIMGPAPSYRESNSVVDKLCNVWRLIDQPLILTAESLQSAVSGLAQWLPAGSLKVCAIEALREQSPDKNYHPCQPDDLVFFNLTSGSTVWQHGDAKVYWLDPSQFNLPSAGYQYLV
jgi:acyl-CoA synthetase (AMP-forming)/AMP-acid ligase II